MRQLLDRTSSCFSAGAFGGLMASLAIWAAGAYHLTYRLGVSFAPTLTPSWLYPHIVWGGLWGFLFVLPVVGGQWWLRGILLSVVPAAFLLFYVLPHETGDGLLGLRLGTLMPAVVLAASMVWGLSAAWVLRMTCRA